ncbi:Serine/threonine-protein kinase [Rhynchospora pubera]|uniref:non-specific serine/threonine protein kinase n=1 Tax=Rhynchospora pubera TaxID=906938 RepID=A0AAV8DH16_9POAL|nr:Serine/threonine-protein kinase [Rhynchospora pubera]
MSPSSLLLPPFLILSLLSLASAASILSFSSSESPWGPNNGTHLISTNRTFTAGFRKGNSKPDSFFFGVWFTNSRDQFVVWSIFRDTPFDSSTQFSVSSRGELSLTNTSSSQALWTVSGSNSSQLILKDSGELQFDKWSSFNFPIDTILANQTIPNNGTTLQKGEFKFLNASVLAFQDNDTYSNSAKILNLTTDGTLMMSDTSKQVASDVGKTDRLRRLTLDQDGNLRLYSLNATSRTWRVVWQAVQELCTIRGTCGRNAICVPVGSTSTQCVCPPGYKHSTGTDCILKSNYSSSSSKFLQLDFVEFGDSNNNYMQSLSPINFADCKSQCLKNSSCVAFSYMFTGNRDCNLLFSPLKDGYWSPATETATYMRVSESETDTSNFTGMTQMIETVCPVRLSLPIPPKEAKTTARNIAIITILFSLELLAGVLSFWAFLKKYSKYRDMARTFGLEYLPAGGPRRFSYAELKAATSDFSNIVGKGGYGVVYKGQLPDGRAIAVKRLKNISGGEAEFWAEVTIIARMHHLNLVRMWGFCADKEQRMLVYEYVSNGSLDKFLFPAHTNLNDNVTEDETDTNTTLLQPPRPLLDWNTRYRIALGVARAIAYLHEECLEWVLHCDIKPENILLEDDFCPKVSDFGLSKLTNKKDKVTMSKIRGTRGYMAPEWVIHREPITAKADVYSFGMVLLEIVSGRRNYQFQRDSTESEDWYFPKWAFEKVYIERSMEEIVDPRIIEGANDEAVERMVKTAIWCVQDRAELRPSMGKVAKMLEGTVEITEPAKPIIFCMPDEH